MSAVCRRCGLRWAAPYSASVCCEAPAAWDHVEEAVGFALLCAVLLANLVLWSIVFQP